MSRGSVTETDVPQKLKEFNNPFRKTSRKLLQISSIAVAHFFSMTLLLLIRFKGTSSIYVEEKKKSDSTCNF